MRVLAIETSGRLGGAALLEGDRLLGEVVIEPRETFSRGLAALVAWLLERTGTAWEAVDLVAVGLGPGRFTGLRVGVATAQGLAFALDRPILGVPTLDALARLVTPAPGDLVCPLVDARRREVYAAVYRAGGTGELDRVAGPEALRPEDLARLLPAGAGRAWLLGDGLDLYRDRLLEAAGPGARPCPGGLFHFRAAAVGAAALERWRATGKGDDPAALSPVYVRPSDARLPGA
ncbi:tRNA (adenosine(37)-N6)-threonylcarbamoyltransferase complex dimerization subunit type 1 TsaB [Dissulfurirhabdus thermomarina]|uniref:tRNA (Adenosine(37)-N6)-threonylcarbamoyltransferase complex dimerization subunit type 1 TsaB n=1 Tax=Dissulfurirhabdus thermomarina TaxID=1765737 RepID=A0A6N9TQR2_DISTH|nr:tRNA (adenosine(37)-N6)-threonylcarbamoyltransferase complex dimerization subunit type 1 TsaB [Dissulfurirhabdus thermomarina]NDY42790.1 tRNA (adenosine(37)-N6)-threonylcarbamoyltransferase complex dimerization subunit type 1 TsaB [Dissulfurirhabdus thermomarina]NMX23562.1 tRNA (adenosine(37)-N6)-threonylcarbamoyltransferase complex dimerization subunit type 1 TsaB [Dissulfurirhabdus thermomarina]